MRRVGEVFVRGVGKAHRILTLGMAGGDERRHLEHEPIARARAGGHLFAENPHGGP